MLRQQLRWQVVDQHLTAGRHDGNPAAGVFQLAHIAGPGQGLEVFLGLGPEHLGLHRQLLCGPGKEMPGQGGNILATFRQSGDMNADHVQPVEQVLAELAGLHQRFQILMGSGNDAHIDLDRRVAADPVELAIGQHPQQPGLGFGRHVADLVEEQRAAVGLLEAPAPLQRGAGEGALLVTEQLGLHQLSGNRRHVQRNEWAARPRAVAVQGVGHQLLAGTGLAIDQHRDVGVGEPTDGAEHFLHGGRLADDFRRMRQAAAGAAGFLVAAVGQRTAHQCHRLVDVERLWQVFEGAPLIGGHRTVQIGMCGDDDNRQPRMQLADAGQQLQPAAAGHADIADQHIGPLLPAQPRHGAVGIVETYRLQAILLQGLFQYPADGAIVINDPDIGGWIHSWSPVMGRKRVKVV